jgi:hypothetical protein
MATYQQIYDAVGANPLIGPMTIAVARAQDALQKTGDFPLSAGAKEWVNRDPRREAERIKFFILNTSPVTTKLDAPGTITDADIQAAVNTLVPALVKGA